ncbi:hypothetical protein BH10PLA2_BH10PLA2_14880 [soil metagenome]
MKRSAGAMMLLATLGGCMSMEHKPSMEDYSGHAADHGHQTIGSAVGPWGQPVPYNPAVRQAGGTSAAAGGVVTAGYSPGIDNLKGTGIENGLVRTNYNVPPQLPGFAGMNGMGACVANAGGGMPGPMMGMQKRTEVRFVGPNGMKISWYVPSGDGKGAFSPSFLTAPSRYNFMQGALYRLKLSEIANRPGLELYPTLEVVPSGPRSDAFLAHSAVPITFTDEDLDQVAAGNFVVKVIYLPDPQYQDLATVGPDEVVSSRLEPGVDPLAEAQRRGNILLVIRLGNIDLEAPNTPAMDAPVGNAPRVGVSRAPGARVMGTDPRAAGGMMTMDPRAGVSQAAMNVKSTGSVMVDGSSMSSASKPGTANASSTTRSAAMSSRPDTKVDTSQANWWDKK